MTKGNNNHQLSNTLKKLGSLSKDIAFIIFNYLSSFEKLPFGSDIHLPICYNYEISEKFNLIAICVGEDISIYNHLGVRIINWSSPEPKDIIIEDDIKIPHFTWHDHRDYPHLNIWKQGKYNSNIKLDDKNKKNKNDETKKNAKNNMQTTTAQKNTTDNDDIHTHTIFNVQHEDREFLPLKYKQK